MSYVIIGIHGLANKPPEDVLSGWWQDAIYEGLENLGGGAPAIEFDMVFWADHLHPELQDPDRMEQPYTPSS